MTGVGDDSRGRLVGRPWFVVGLALALAATLALVLADDIRYLRLGIVAALWAALVGAFLAVRYRKQASSTEDAVAQAQEVYELELEREIAARREYELEVEAETRSRVQADSRNELDALRAEVSALRDNLQSLFGGEVLLERVALTAQATRMRALREEQRIVESGPGSNGNGNRSPAQLTAAPTPPSKERPTQFMDRVREKQSARAGGRPAAPEPRRPERSMDLPQRRPPNEAPSRGNGAAASVAKAAADARAEQTRVQQAAALPREQRRDTRAESTRPAFSPSERARRAKAEKPAQPPEPVEEPTKMSKPVDADWTPSWEGRFNRDRGDNGNTAPKTPEPQIPPAPEPVAARLEPPQEELPPPSNPTLPVEVRRAAQEARGGGRRRRSEEESPAETSAGGGRRRRPENEAPSWGAAPGGQHSGSHARPDVTPGRPGESSGYQEPVRRSGEASGYRNPTPRRSGESSGYRSAPQSGRRSDESSGYRPALEESTPTGSHASGRSVSDLLKAHGTTDAIPRRRRRAED
ncbi:hypothetical protein FPZ12_030990 [Amycolatopsis acidicola]|uniref:DUF6779 domain-containing protein n=1 Tax=Amycolatopsis acidicola TaxID=2596893 RepID=A0A5N0UW94_9PSEU|nr:DUF6779 domain-containing protein [Amycolatopsis acidicola]KAA9154952.1 hypothetical protein FPZ12_030990 [Amycolatopsis acidicola]